MPRRTYRYRCVDCGSVSERTRLIKNRNRRVECSCGGLPELALDPPPEILRAIRATPLTATQLSASPEIGNGLRQSTAIRVEGGIGITIQDSTFVNVGTSVDVTDGEVEMSGNVHLNVGTAIDAKGVSQVRSRQGRYRGVARVYEASDEATIEAFDEEALR